MDAIKFRITTTDGRTVVGPVQGSGGLVGAGLSHCAPRKARAAALARLRAWVAGTGPETATVFPDYSAEGNGEPVVVAIRGASVELARPRKEVRA